MKILLYIPCRNGENTLPEVFESVGNQIRKADGCLLINDLSTDRTEELAKVNHFEVIPTSNEKHGLAVGRNLALKYAVENGFEILAGIDADAVIAPDYVEQIDLLFTNNPEIVAAGGKMIERYRDTIPDMWRSIHLKQHWGDHPFLNPPILFGSSSMHRVSVLSRLNGWNENLKTNWEDTELTERLMRSGYKIAYNPLLKLEHLKRDNIHSVLRMFWNWYFDRDFYQGNYQSLPRWADTRLDWIWRDYQHRMLTDSICPQVSVVSLLLPWSLILRDLVYINKSSNTNFDLRPIMAIANNMLSNKCKDSGTVTGLMSVLHTIYVENQPAVPVSIPDQIAAKVNHLASSFIPDRNYWSFIDSAFQTSASQQ